MTGALGGAVCCGAWMVNIARGAMSCDTCFRSSQTILCVLDDREDDSQDDKAIRQLHDKCCQSHVQSLTNVIF